MSIAFRQLQVFVAVVQEGSITGAAARLHLTKPAVSMALSELEKHLDHVLFDRHKNRLTLNHQGKQLLPLAAELLERTRTIEDLFSDTNLKGQLLIGASDTVGNQVVPYLLRDFRTVTNHNDQRLFVSNTREVCRRLLDFELDIGLVEGQVQDKLLSTAPWCGDDMVVVCSPHHPLASHRELTLHNLENTDWLLRESGSGSREFFLHHLAPRLANWSIALELNNTEAIINCCAAGLGLACVSHRAVSHGIADNRLHALSLPLSMRRDYLLVYHKQKYASPLLKTFIQFAHDWQPDQ